MKLGKAQLKEMGVCKELIYVIDRQFKAIKQPIKNFDFTQKDWYCKYSWTSQQSEKFMASLKNWIKTNRSKASCIWSTAKWSDDKGIDMMVRMYDLMWGWKIDTRT